jgi:glycosyltransferase involved in cell wall biosynthesis
MIGDGPLRDRCEATIAELGLGGRVTLLLAQDNDAVVELLQQASVFAQHSVIAANGDTEGLPVAILEAMASGLPVVSTVHAGIPEAVEHGTTGILVAELDIRGMAEAIAALLDDPGRAETMGRAGRARVLQNFTIDHTRDRLRAIMGLPSTTFEASAVSNPELVGRA